MEGNRWMKLLKKSKEADQNQLCCFLEELGSENFSLPAKIVLKQKNAQRAFCAV